MSTNKDDHGGASPDTGTTKYLHNSKTISGRLDDELVMMDIEQGKYFSLNPVATRIWELLERPLNLNELCVLLMDEYEVELKQCQEETLGYLDEMTGLGMVLKIRDQAEGYSG